MKKIKINYYKSANTLFIMNAKLAFVDNVNNRFGFWISNDVKIYGKITSWSFDISQQINFVMITFNYTRELEEFINLLDKNEYVIKEYK